jgi:uncharacterized NAD(P)/FAD-binding protein YdhS
MPAPCAEAVSGELKTGSLYVHPGTILSVEASDDRVIVTWRPRGSEVRLATRAVRVFDATGASNAAASPDRLLGCAPQARCCTT